MKTALCPISYKRINGNIARGNAVVTVLLLTVYVLTASPFVIAFLLLDFLLRSFEMTRYSPVAILSAQGNKWLNISPSIINAGPKLFSARVGAVFCFLVFVSLLAGWDTVAWIITAIFGVCAFLEAVFGFCVACTVYPYVFGLFKRL